MKHDSPQHKCDCGNPLTTPYEKHSTECNSCKDSRKKK